MSVRTIVGVSNDEKRIFTKVESLNALNAGRTSILKLQAADSGKIFKADGTNGVTFELPAVEEGVNFKFVVTDTFGPAVHSIQNVEGDSFYGYVINDGADTLIDGHERINFSDTNSSIGDFVDVWSDGVKWIVYGVGRLPLAIISNF
jgi:hypothetical protein